MRIKMILLTSMMTLFLSSCMNIEPTVLNEINIATAISYDYIDKDHFTSTAVTPYYLPDKRVNNVTFTATSSLSKDVRQRMNQQTDKPIFSGKIEVVLYSKELAKHDLIRMTDTLIRDPSIGNTVYLAVVDGKAQDVLIKQFGNVDKGTYLSNAIEHNIQSGILPKTNLHLFSYAHNSEGMDPFLPIIKPKNGNPIITGVALFDQGKFVYQTKDHENIIFKMLVETSSNKEGFSAKLGENLFASVYNISSKVSYNIPEPMTNSPIMINLKVEAVLREFTGEQPDKKVIRTIEKKMEKELKQRAEKLIVKLQKLEVDPLGVGEQVRTRTRSWNKDEWKSLYPTIPFQVNVNFEILESGAVE
ncbi:Ger(x)C family spore germination protein [Peribacillus huizhouensis]|uniref:Spore germination protein n=1 Tax=Peribacillus huizhouensis TaxID=1501239 RepID=A0ABR6CMH3_9BACI|nr:Ger(x)C family spore germination protein [Peribacillus huizhouensis]MBA9026213.1 spore germination protein [Peribacillus huizhouensis]